MSAEGFVEVLDTLPYGDLKWDSVTGILTFIVPTLPSESVKYVAPMRAWMPVDLWETFFSEVDDIWRHRTGRSILPPEMRIE